MAVPQDTPGAGAASDVVAAAIEDVAQTDPVETGAADTQPVEAAAGDGIDGSGAEGGDVDVAAQAADLADLEQYPEALRERFKSLEPSERKALYEQAEARVEERIRSERERNDKLAAEAKAQDDRRKAIQQRIGTFTGYEAQTLELPDGSSVTLPSYDELARLTQNQRGRVELATKYGMNEADAEFWKFVLDDKRQMLDAVVDDLDLAAWGKLDTSLKDGLRAEGLDPVQILDGAKSPHDVVRQLVGHLKAGHEAEIKKLKADYEGRVGALNLNAEGLRARAVAGSTRSPATGGRAGGAPPTELTPETYATMTYEERRKLRSTPEGRAQIDAMMGGGGR